MRVLLDECVPERLRHDLQGGSFVVETARYAGLSKLSNGALLAAAAGRYDAMVTTDKTLRHEQNLSRLSIGIVVITSVDNDFSALRPMMPQVAAALRRLSPGQLIEV